MTFYDCEGKAIAYTDERQTIFLFNGNPVAYFYGSLIYNFRGEHLGVIKSGWIRDNNGLCVFFTEDAVGGPLKPLKRVKPMKGLRKIVPLKGLRHTPYMQAIDKNEWSEKSGARFFI